MFIKKTIDQFFVFFKRTCAHLELKETKYHPFSTVKGKSTLALSVYFYITNNFAELKPLPMVEFPFNTLPCWFSIASSLNCVSDFTADIFYFRKGSLWLNIFAKRDNKKDKNINISNLKKDFRNLKHTFWASTIEVQCYKKLFQNLFTRRSWIFWKYHEKETVKTTPKIEKIIVLYI